MVKMKERPATGFPFGFLSLRFFAMAGSNLYVKTYGHVIDQHFLGMISYYQILWVWCTSELINRIMVRYIIENKQMGKFLADLSDLAAHSYAS